MLTITITSFSFLNGPSPQDESGNGGGFVFDCRALPNPGRLDEFKSLSGKDAPVVQFLDSSSEVAHFLEAVYSLVDQSVKKYQERDFSNLMIGFGCTGGQHRSVYAAEKLSGFLKENFDVNIRLFHLNQENWRKFA
jgi:RNase adaptor protein for sRNA GlmZ degradation